MNYVYKLVGQGLQPLNVEKATHNVQPNTTINAPPGQTVIPGGQEKNKFLSKYDNLIKQSTELCRKYTGPHSVL
jgi:hypothetical protein